MTSRVAQEDTKPFALVTEEDARRYCSRSNARAEAVGWQRWSWVRRYRQGDVETWRLEVIEDGYEVRRYRDGKLEPYVGWSEERMDKLRNQLRWKLRQGMAPEEFDAWRQGAGWFREQAPAAQPDLAQADLL